MRVTLKIIYCFSCTATTSASGLFFVAWWLPEQRYILSCKFLIIVATLAHLKRRDFYEQGYQKVRGYWSWCNGSNHCSPELTDNDKKKGLTKDSKEFRNKLAQNGLKNTLKSKPASFYIPEYAKLITIGNLEDDLGLLGHVDWIIEVVVERLDIKKSVFEKVETVLKPGTIISSNTSGIHETSGNCTRPRSK